MAAREATSAKRTPELELVSSACAALHRDGGMPRGALDLLYTIVAEEVWRRVETAGGGAYASFAAFAQAPAPFGLDCPADELRKILELQHPGEQAHVAEIAERMAWLRGEIRRLLGEDIEPARPARVKGSERTTLRTETAERHLARLKRDDPGLAEKVVNGQVSAYAAARSKGWKPPRIQVTTPERTANHLRKHLTPDQLRELARLLTNDDNQQDPGDR